MTQLDVYKGNDPSPSQWEEYISRDFHLLDVRHYRHNSTDRPRGRSHTATIRRAELIVSKRLHLNLHVRGSLFDLKNVQYREEICEAILNARWSDSALKYVSVRTPKGFAPIRGIVEGTGAGGEELSPMQVRQLLFFAIQQVKQFHELQRLNSVENSVNLSGSVDKDAVSWILMLLEEMYAPVQVEDGDIATGFYWDNETSTLFKVHHDVDNCVTRKPVPYPPSNINKLSITMCEKYISDPTANGEFTEEYSAVLLERLKGLETYCEPFFSTGSVRIAG